MNLFVQLIGLTTTLLHYGSVFVNGQSYVLTSSCGGVVTEGSSCVLTCETGDASQIGILWRKDANPSVRVDRASCTTSPPAFPSKYVLDCSGTSFTLNITNADSEQDAASWTCDFLFGGKESSSINTVVEVPLKDVQLTFNPDPVEEGKIVNVSCTTSACNPRANVSISFDGTKHNGPSSTVPQNSLFITVVSVMLTADATKNVSCSADNGGATISKELPFPVPKHNPTSTATPGGPTTPTAGGMCKDINCNLFFLLLLLLFIPIIGVIIGCSRKKKKPKSNSNVMNSIGEKNEPVSAENHVNNDKSD